MRLEERGLAGRRAPRVLPLLATGVVLALVQAATITADRVLALGPTMIGIDLAITGIALAIVTLLERSADSRKQESEALREAMQAARRAQEAADAANSAKTDFLACMSHEIRTPLNSVIGFAELLLDQIDLAPRSRLYGERIQSGGAALLTIVDDILEFSRVEAGAVSIEPAPFSLPGLVDECISLVQHAAQAKGLSLHVSFADRLPPTVLGDAARLRQIMLNLLNNAIKFTEVGSVTLDLRRDRAVADADHVVVSVIDTGIGIAREDQAGLFQRFAQVDASIRRTYGGTGLGLAICKRLVVLMGGSIGVDSQKGQGSTFFFSVPLGAAVLESADARPKVVETAASCRVLLVEDVPINQDLVCQILTAKGHEVDIVGNGAEAVMAVQDMDYDVVLMDVQMPYLDGLAATRMIRALPHHCCDVPIVAMTANVLPEQTAAARAAGMGDVIHKPFSAAEILDAVARAGSPTLRPAAAPGSQPMAEDFPELDMAVLDKLAAFIGEAKVRSLLHSLASSLRERLLADISTPEGRAQMRLQAHASVAGSGMLGFLAFSKACKAFQVAGEDGFEARLDALRRQADAVASRASEIADQPGHLSQRAAA